MSELRVSTSAGGGVKGTGEETTDANEQIARMRAAIEKVDPSEYAITDPAAREEIARIAATKPLWKMSLEELQALYPDVDPGRLKIAWIAMQPAPIETLTPKPGVESSNPVGSDAVATDAAKYEAATMARTGEALTGSTARNIPVGKNPATATGPIFRKFEVPEKAK